MDSRIPRLILPAGSVQSSGLWVPTSGIARPAVLNSAMGLRFRLGRDAAAPRLVAFADEAAVGLEKSSESDFEEMVARLPFCETVIAIAHLGAALWKIRTNGEGQLALIEHLLGSADPLVEDLRRWIHGDAARVVFGEQQIFLLLRMTMTHASPGVPKWPLGYPDAQLFFRALLAAGSQIATATSHLEDEHDLEKWLPYVVQNRMYNDAADPLASVGRSWAIYHDAAESLAWDERLMRPCELLRRRHGFDLADQIGIGMGLLAASSVLDEGVGFAKPSFISAAAFVESATLSARSGEVFALVASSREDFKSQFATPGLTDLAWNNVPFIATPLIALDEDTLIVPSPRSLLTWMGDGLYHRLLAAANAVHGQRGGDLFQARFGELFQDYAEQLARWALKGVGIVHSDGPQGGIRPPDLPIELGGDLVLVEVVSSRLRMPSRLGDAHSVEVDIQRAVVAKARQLADRIRDFSASPPRLALPGHDFTKVRRIWPVILTYDGLPMQPPLWAYLDREIGSALDIHRVQPLTVLDIGDFENLMALVKDGRRLEALLERKTQAPFAREDFGVWLDADPLAPTKPDGCPYLEGRFQAAADAAMSSLSLRPGS